MPIFPFMFTTGSDLRAGPHGAAHLAKLCCLCCAAAQAGKTWWPSKIVFGSRGVRLGWDVHPLGCALGFNQGLFSISVSRALDGGLWMARGWPCVAGRWAPVVEFSPRDKVDHCSQGCRGLAPPISCRRNASNRTFSDKNASLIS